MATFGRDVNQDRADSAQKNAIKATAAKQYTDPFGTFKSGKTQNVFKPNITPDIQSGLDQFGGAIGNLSGQLDQPFDVNSYYNNPFYSTVSEQYRAPILRQYQQDSTDLDNSLNARNQIGSSYDALMRRNLGQQRDFQLNQADDQARLASANAYQQAFQNLLASLGTALGGRGQLQDQIYAPAKIAMGYQQALNPLQTAQAGIYGNAMSQYLSRPTSTDRIMQFYNTTAQSAGQAAGAMYGGA